MCLIILSTWFGFIGGVVCGFHAIFVLFSREDRLDAVKAVGDFRFGVLY